MIFDMIAWYDMTLWNIIIIIIVIIIIIMA